MTVIPDKTPGRFCWMDLAASDSQEARGFYAGLFGWRPERHAANGGELFRLKHQGEPIASLYQLRSRELAGGVPSHWTPYIAVSNVEETASKAASLGGHVVVEPLEVDGMARVALLADSVGALVGIWESTT